MSQGPAAERTRSERCICFTLFLCIAKDPSGILLFLLDGLEERLGITL